MKNGDLKMGVLWDLTDFHSTLHLNRIASLNLVSLLLTDHIYWHSKYARSQCLKTFLQFVP